MLLKKAKQTWNSFGLKSSSINWLPTMVYRIHMALSIQTKYSRLRNFQIAVDFNFYFGIYTHILLQA